MQNNHDPGQFVQLSVPGIGECPISICSDSRDFIKLNVHEVGNVTKAITAMKKGDMIYVRGPYGKGYPMRLLKGNSFVIVGGGCGAAPLKGVLDYIINHQTDYKDVNLFLGFRSPEAILFKRELEHWRAKHKVSLTVDKAPAGQFCYNATEGHITELIRMAPFDNAGKIAIVCGPPPMMTAVIKVLQDKGFHDDQIFISAERLMYCATGTCCHCMIQEKYTCIDGPVFRYDEMKGLTHD